MADKRRLAVAIFFVVLAGYLLTYSGAFRSNDERALFSGTDSFVKRGNFTTDQIYWDYTHVGMLTTGGEMVPNYEPAPMFLNIPTYLWGQALGAAEQGTLFLTLFELAGAAAVLYLCVVELGYGRRTAAATALIFAFATQVWIYSRTLFREPLTVLLYLVAIYALLRMRPGPAEGARRSLAWPALLGFTLGLAFTTKQISVALLPTVALLLFIYERRRPGTLRDRLPALLVLIVPIGIFLLLNEAYRNATLAGVTTFARDIGEYTTNPQLSTSAPVRMIRAALGLAVSPYKGLLWYSPVLLLGLIGAVPFLRRHLWEGIACLVALAVHLGGYSRYLYWSGGVAWGSRYMLVQIPFLMLLAAPVFAWLLHDRPAAELETATTARPGWALPAQVGAWLLVALSFGVQIVGVAIDWQTYELRFLLTQAKVWGGIGEAIDALYMVPRYSPVFGNLQLLLTGREPLDFAWVQHRPQGAWALAPTGLAISLAALAVAVLALVWLWRHPGHTARLGLALGAAMVVACSALLLTYRQGDARFDPNNVDRFLRPMNAALGQAVSSGQVACCRTGTAANAACSGVLLVPDPTLTDYYLNYFNVKMPWYGFYANPLPTQLLDQLLARYGDVWLARDRNAAADDQENTRGPERYLTDHAYKVSEQQFGDWARLLHFSANGAPAEAGRPGQPLSDMTLDSFILGVGRGAGAMACGAQQAAAHAAAPAAEPLNDGKVQAQAGDTLQIGLTWSAQGKPASNYTAFVQLLDEGSQVKGQSDRWPGDGLYPTGTLSAGQVITDNVGLRLDVPPGHYRLIAGMYRNDLPNYPRLSGPQGDSATLAEVDVR